MNAVRELLARYVERHLLDGTRLDPAVLCGDAPHLAAELSDAIARYHALDETMGRTRPDPREGTAETAPLPAFEGFRTIERIGQGGMGAVYKLEDPRLHRTVAAKVVRADRAGQTSLADFLREARALALFQDPRVVAVHEFRPDATPPVIIMEHVDGFPIAQVAPSLDYAHRARLVAEIADALHHAHSLGITHRDLKPANVLLDSRLQPKILDFGLASANPREGHGAGTPHYLAPEQLDPSRPIDARTDIHALGVMLYEILCGARPYDGATQEDVLAAVLAGRPRLPCEVEPSVPEPLQAVALKAMETEPSRRYATARDMAQDLRRFVDGRPVLARPTLYATALEQRVRPHLDALDEWQRLNLVHPHEAERLKAAYERLDAREEDWIVAGRSLSWPQITLYLGAALLGLGSVLFFAASRLFEQAEGLLVPLAALGLPLLALNAVAWRLWRTEHRPVAVAFHVATAILLPLLLLIVFSETGFLAHADAAGGQLLGDLSLSNRQLQAALLAGAAWSFAVAWRTRTVALSAAFCALLVLAHVALLSDFGLVDILDEARWDALSGRLVPLLAACLLAGWAMDTRRRTWFSSALFVTSSILLVAVLGLACLDGRLLARLGVSLVSLQPEGVADPLLIDTLAGMTACGFVIYLAGDLAERSSSRALRAAAQVLLVLAPFAILEPLFWLNRTGDYGNTYLWAYLAAATGIVFASRVRQRRTFFHAGLVNVAVAIWLITDRYDWFERRWWGALVAGAGVAALVTGWRLQVSERERGGRAA